MTVNIKTTKSRFLVHWFGGDGKHRKTYPCDTQEEATNLVDAIADLCDDAKVTVVDLAEGKLEVTERRVQHEG